MSRIFLSYSSDGVFEARALRDWLNANGWDEVALGPERAEGAQEDDSRRRARREYASRCNAVVILVSREWLASRDRRDEYDVARELNKAVVVALIEDLPLDEPGLVLARSDRVVPLHGGENQQTFPVAADGGGEAKQISFSVEGLEKLKAALAQIAVDARFFDWPPKEDSGRAPYRGFDALEAADAGVFFGREEPLIEALDAHRGLVEAPGPRLFLVLGVPGVGKSSFLRAGLWPRLERDRRNFFPLPVIRPGSAAINGADGLAAALVRATEKAGGESSVAKIREALAGGSDALRALLRDVAGRAAVGPKPPTLVVGVDRAEELFRAEGAGESDSLLRALRNLAASDDPAVLLVLAMRSDSYGDLARASALGGVKEHVFPLASLPPEGLRAAIEGPAKRVAQAGGTLEIDPDLTQALLEDVKECGGDSLPLLAFALEKLYRASGAAKRLTRADYESFGGLAGAIDATFERVLRTADADPRIPKEKEARLALLRGALVPGLAGVDLATRTARRRIAGAEQIPQDARPLIEHLVAERLLTQKVNAVSGETTFELAHEALLRRWGALANWLEEEFESFALLDGVKRASRRWEKRSRLPAFAAHSGVLLEQAQRLYGRSDLTALLDVTDRAYLVACFDQTKQVRGEEEQRARSEVERLQKESERQRRRAQNARWGALASSLGLAGALFLAAFAGWQWMGAASARREALTQREHVQKAASQLTDAADRLALDLAERLKELSFAPPAVKLDILSNAHRLQEKVIESSGASDNLKRSESVVLNEIAQARLATGDFSGALEAARESTKLMAALSAAKPDNASFRRDLSVSYERLGDAQQALGDSSGALKSYLEDLAIAQALSSSDAENPQWRWDLSISNEKIGDVQQAQNDLKGALNSYREALTNRGKALASNPQNASWRRDLAVSHERVGSILAKQGDLEGAIAAFELALSIYQALVGADPNDAQSLAYSIVPHWRLAELDKGRQREHLEAALGNLHALAAKDRLDAKRQSWLAQIEAQLKALDQASPAIQPNTKPGDGGADRGR